MSEFKDFSMRLDMFIVILLFFFHVLYLWLMTILVLNLNEFGLKRIGKISSMVTFSSMVTSSKVYSSDSSGVGGGTSGKIVVLFHRMS